MPLIHELKGSRNLAVGREGASCPWRFMVREAADEAEAYQLADDSTPATYQPIPGLAGVLAKAKIDVEDLGAGVFHVTVNFESGQPTEAGEEAGNPPSEPAGGAGDTSQGGGNVAGDTDPNALLGREFTFTTAGGSTHVNKARSLIDSGKVGGGAAPDAKLAIGLSKEGVAGVDIITPSTEYAFTHKVKNLTISRIIRLAWATGKMNLVPWWGFGEFEVLFLGCDGKWSDGDDAWTLTYRFRYEPTERNIDILGDASLVCAEKAGHDYLWVAYEAQEGGGDFRIQMPFAYYVHRVYKPINFQIHLGL